MQPSWKDSIYLQREELARRLRTPLAQLAERCAPAWGDRERLNGTLANGLAAIPYCTYLYALDCHGLQVSDNFNHTGLVAGHFGRDRSQRPYMQEAVPAWGFLLSDAYISLFAQRPSLTALQVVRREGQVVGYVGADFDLRDLPVTSTLYEEPGHWRQVRGDPAIRGTLFEQTRAESAMDRHLEQSCSIIEELLTERGVFQTQLHFSSSQAMIWLIDDPLRYRMLDSDALGDPDICLVYPRRPYPDQALVPQGDIARVLKTMQALRLADDTLYLRQASINLFNGLVGLTFSCDGSHYMRYDELLHRDIRFWLGA